MCVLYSIKISKTQNGRKKNDNKTTRTTRTNKNKQKQLYNCRSDGSIKQHNKFFSDIQSNLREEKKTNNENAEAPPAQL
jgi:hypothetical protein